MLIGGPDVREVIRAVRSARRSEPDLAAGEVVALVSANAGIPTRVVDTAIRYWADYPDEIDTWIDEVEGFEEQQLHAWERRQDLLARWTDGPRLLLDEMLSGDIAAQLRTKGHDVVAVVDDPAVAGTPDEELLAHATATGRCLVTANVRDFASCHASWSSRGRSHCGLVYIVHRVFPSDRSFVGAVVTALDSSIGEGRVPPSGAEAYLRRQQP